MNTKKEDKGPYSFGETIIKHKGVYVNTVINNKDFEALIEKLQKNNFTYETGYVPEGYIHRPDAISNIFYNTPKYWWLLMLANNINDPFEGFYLNQKIIIPTI